MKRVISLLVALALVLGYIGAIPFGVYAQAEYVDRVYIHTQEFYAGEDIPADPEVEVTDATLVECKGWLDDDGNPATGVFVANRVYELVLVLQAPEGMLLGALETTFFPNGYGNYRPQEDPQDPSRMTLYIEFDFNPRAVRNCNIGGAPDYLEPGPAPAVEDVFADGSVVLTDVCWVDMDKKPVTVLEEGKRYLLEVTLAPEDGCEFRDWLDVYGHGGQAYSSQIVSKQEAKAWIVYSLEPGVGAVDITVTGVGIGLPISGVSATVPEAAAVTVRSLIIYNNSLGESVEEGVFEEGYDYDITVMLAPKDGYNGADYGPVTANGQDLYSCGYWNGLIQADVRFSTSEPVGRIDVDLVGLAEGAPVADVQVLLSGDGRVKLNAVRIWDDVLNEQVQDGVFETGKLYRVWVELVADRGYSFQEGFALYVNGKEQLADSGSAYMYFNYYLSTQEKIGAVELTLVEPEEGAAVADAVVTGQSDQYQIIYQWLDRDTWEPAQGVFQADREYLLEMQLIAQEGYSFDPDVIPTVNGEPVSNYTMDGDCSWMGLSVERSFQYSIVKWAEIMGAPSSIAAGDAQIPALEVWNDAVQISSVRWLDTDRQPVTRFENGKAYFLEVTLTTRQGYKLAEYFEVYGEWLWPTEKQVTDKKATVCFYYALMPGVGDIRMNVSGVAVGAPVCGVSATVSGEKVRVVEITVLDAAADEVLTEGNFETDRFYTIEYRVEPAEGYDITNLNGVFINGGGAGWSTQYDHILVTQEFVTGTRVEQITLRPTGITAGSAVSEVGLEIPEDTHLILDAVHVEDADTYEECLEGTLQKNKNYRVYYELKFAPGYFAADYVELDVEGLVEYGYNNMWLEVIVEFNTYDKLETVSLSFPEPQPGMALADVVITGEDTLYSIEQKWHSYQAGDDIQGSVFQKEDCYYQSIALTVLGDYRFAGDVQVTVNGELAETVYLHGEGRCLQIDFEYDFRSQEVEYVQLTDIPEDIAAGAAPEQTPTVDYGEAAVTATRWVDVDGEAVTGFADGSIYYLEVTLQPMDGYVLYDGTGVWSEYHDAYKTELQADGTMKVFFRYSLMRGVGDIALTVTGLSQGAPVSGIKATPAAGAKVRVVGTTVIDRSTDEIITGSIEAAKRYRIVHILEALDGYDISKVGDVYINEKYVYEYYCEDEQLYLMQEFSTYKPMGVVKLATTGLEAGKPVSGVQLQLVSGQSVDGLYVTVQDYDTGAIVNSGVFEPGHTYRVYYAIGIREGYSPEEGIELFLNGEGVGSYSWDGYTVEFSEYFSTCTPVEKIDLKVTQPQVGAAIEDATLTCTTEGVTVEYAWVDQDTYEIATGTFRKGVAYSLTVNVLAAQGYTLTEKTAFLVNGVKLANGWINESGKRGECSVDYSFREKITAVALPALPASLKAGDKLPAVTVTQGQNYTVSWGWGTVNSELEAGDTVEKGLYELYFSVQPARGYEFASDVTVTAGGKSFDGTMMNSIESLFVIKNYIVGMPVIDRIDLSVAEPVVGGQPGAVTVSKNAPYEVEDAAWWSSPTDKVEDAGGVEVFEPESYIFLMLASFAKDGYAFADQVDVYVNGKKLPLAMDMNLGYYRQTAVSFGKLQALGSEGAGDLDGLLGVNEDDVAYLLRHILMPGLFRVEQDVDFNGDGKVNEADAIRLLQYVLLPEQFPLQ